jgi:uncharacterized integral membrane protein
MSMPSYGQTPAPEPPARRTVSPRLVVGLVLVVISVIFIVENTQKVKVRFLVPRVSAPLWLALVVTFLLGALVGWLWSRRAHRRRAE